MCQKRLHSQVKWLWQLSLTVLFVSWKVTVDATLEAKLLQTEILAKILAAPSLNAFYKKKTFPLKIATRNKRGPVFFKCVRVDYDKETGKLNLGDIAGKSVRTGRSEEEDKEYQETVVGSEIDQSDWAGKLRQFTTWEAT